MPAQAAVALATTARGCGGDGFGHGGDRGYGAETRGRREGKREETHGEVEAQLSGPGDDLDGANRRRGRQRPKVEEELEVDAAGLPAGRGSVRGSRMTSRSSWAQPRGEGVAVAVVVLIGGGGRVRWK